MSDKTKQNREQPEATDTAERPVETATCNPISIRWRFACLLPAFVVFMVYWLSAPKKFHEDEVYWIGSTYYFQLALIDRNASSPDWQLLPARENPAIGKYILGTALHWSGNSVTTPDLLGSFYLMFANMPGAWGSDEAFAKRLAVANRVAPEWHDAVRTGRDLPLNEAQLSVARNTSFLFGVLASIGIAVLGQQCNWKAGGVIAGILFALHPIVIDAYSLAMIDIIAIACSVWFLVGLVSILRLPTPEVPVDNEKGQAQAVAKNVTSRKTFQTKNTEGSLRLPDTISLKRFACVLFTAVMLALACGSKMNSLIVAMTGAVCGMWCVFETTRRIFTKRNSVQQNSKSHHNSVDTLAGNLEIWKSRTHALGGAAVLAVIIFIGSNPALYGDPVDGVHALSYEHALTADIQEDILGGRLTSLAARFKALANLVCFSPWAFTGICVAVIWTAYNCMKKQTLGIILVLWWIIALLLLILWMPFAWDRYALPLITPTMLILGMTLEKAANLGWSMVTRANRTVVS